MKVTKQKNQLMKAEKLLTAVIEWLYEIEAQNNTDKVLGKKVKKKRGPKKKK